MKKGNNGKKVAAAFLGSLGILSASSELLYAATAQENAANSAAAPANNQIPAQVAAKTILSSEITVLPVGDQQKLQLSLQDLKNKYGEDLMNRMIFKYEDGQLKVIGVQEGEKEMSGSNPSCS